MPVNKYWHPETDAFRKMGAPLPVANVHGTDEQIRERLKPMKVDKWELQGNTLIGYADGVKMAQQIPTDMILTGTDDNGMPILEKISLKPHSQNQIYF